MEWKTKPKFQANDPVVHKQTRQRGYVQDVTMLSEYAVLANLLKGRQQVLVKWHHQEEPTMERMMDLEHSLEHEMPKRSLSAPAQRPCIRVPRISTICADNARRHRPESDAGNTSTYVDPHLANAVQRQHQRPARTWSSPRDSPPAMSGPGWSPDRTAPPECIWTNSGPQRNIMRVKGLDGHYASPDRRSISARAARARPLRQNIAHARTRSSEWTVPPRQKEPRPARSPSAPPTSTRCIYRCGARVRDYYTSCQGTIVVRDVMSTDDNASVAWDGDGTGVTGVHKVNLSRLEPVVPLPEPTRSSSPSCAPRIPRGLAPRSAQACATPAELRGQATQLPSRGPRKCQTYPSFKRSRAFRLNPAQDTDEFSAEHGAGDMKESDVEMQFSPRHSLNGSWSMSRPPRRSSSESSRQDTGSLLNDLLQRENDQPFSSDAADNVNQWVSDLPNLESSHSRDNNSISTSTAFSSGSEDEMKSFEACSSNFESPCAPPRRQLSGSCRFEAGPGSKPTHRRKQSGPLPRQPVRLSTLSPVDERLGPIDSRTPSPTIPLSPGTEVEMASLCSSSESSTPRGSFSEGDRVTHLMNGYTGVVTAVFRHIPHCYVKWDHAEAEEDVNSRDIRLVELPEAPDMKRNGPTEPRSDASSDTHRQSSTSTTSTGSREPMRVGGPVQVKKAGKWLQAKFRGEDALGRPMYASVEYLHRPGVVFNVRRDRIFRTQKKPT